MQEVRQNLQGPMKRGGSSLINIEKGEFILIGGANRSEEFGDIWRLKIEEDLKSNTHTAQWSKIEIPLSGYTPRSSQCAVLTEDQEIHIYGGQSFHENSHFEDHFTFDPKSQKLERINKKQEEHPGARNSSTLSYDSLKKKIYLFGGANSEQPLSDLRVYDLEEKVWRELKTKNGPKGIEMHTCHFYRTQTDLRQFSQGPQIIKNEKGDSKFVDINFGQFPEGELESQEQAEQDLQEGIQSNIQPNIQQQQSSEQRQQLVLNKVDIEFDEKNAVIEDGDSDDEDIQEQFDQIQFEESKFQEEESKLDQNLLNTYLIVVGGRHLDKILNQIHVLDLKTLEWFILKNLPLSICAHASEIVQDNIYIFGGTNGAEFLQNLYIYNLQNNELYQTEISKKVLNLIKMKGRMASAMSYDPLLDKIIIFGGAAYDDELSQLLVFSPQDYNPQNNSKILTK